MSDTDDKSSKTEEPTERKLSRAREQGDSYTTKEPGHLLAYLSLLAVVAVVFPVVLPKALAGFSAFVETSGQISIDSPQDLANVLMTMTLNAATVLLPSMAVFLLGAFISIIASGPFIVSAKRLVPKPSKLNPFAGIKRLVSVDNLIEFAKSLIKLGLIATLCMLSLRQTLDALMPGAIMLPETLLGFISEGAMKSLIWVCAMMLPLVVFDLFWKRFNWMKKQRMTKKEVKDEHKDSDGDPHIRARRHQIRQQRVRQQLTSSVPSATVVITNPTHYAVALKYERGIDVAPVCVAKGADLMALRIRELALEHEVTVIESPPLARALHAKVEVDNMIPEEHWAAVAELVGYVMDLRRRVKRKLPDGARVFDG